MAGLPVADAARILQVRQGTLRRWLREGCPTVSCGRRGRGHAVLVDPETVRLWRAADERHQVFLQLASAVPGILADATVEAWRHASGMDKRRLAGVLAATWYVQTAALLDHMREQCPGVPDITALPEAIVRLRKIERK